MYIPKAFEWDPVKNEVNIERHKIDFRDATRIFDGPVIVRRSDRRDEVRWLAIGRLEGREIALAFTLRGANYRLISARKARRNERREYCALYPG